MKKIIIIFNVKAYYIILILTSMVVGFVMHRSDFCIAGAFRDIWLFKRTTYLKAIFISVALNMLFFELFYKIGIIKNMPYPLINKPNIGNILGGIIFGIGMVCAGSCVVGVLYKIGTGSIIALTTFLGIITGSCIFVLVADHLSFLKNIFSFSSLTLNDILHLNPIILKGIILTIMGSFIFLWFKNKDFSVKSHAEGFINPFLAACFISLGSIISYILAGMPMGVTTFYTKIGVFLMKLFNYDFINELKILHKYPLDFYNYFLNQRLIGGLDSTFDGIVVIQLPVIFGIFAGSFFSAISLKEFNFYYKIPLKQYILTYIGGILMGFGARIGSGCNLWHIWGGLSILALNGIFFVSGLVAGSFIGTHIIKKVLE